VESVAWPTSFKPLLPLIAHWATTDDFDRSIAIREASDDSLNELWQSVKPELSAIDEFLATHPTDESATSLSSLAQAAIEAGRELIRRGVLSEQSV
jgi:hypothetical protein